MKSEGKPGFIMFHELGVQTAYMTDAEFGQLCRAMISYSESGIVPINTQSRVFGAFSIVRSSIDRTTENYERKVAASRENGKKGGRPRKNQENPEVISEPAKANYNYNCNQNRNSNTNKNSKDERGNAPSPTGQYKNVYFTDEELTTLKARYDDWEKRIDRLSEYMAVSGKKYDSHFAVIQMWAKDEKTSLDQTGSFVPGEQEKEAVKRLQKQRQEL